MTWLFLLLVIPAMGDAQKWNEGFVPEREGMQHLLRHPAPEYPPMARAAGLHGPVLLHVTVDRSGAVTRVEAVDGPEMLRASSTAAVLNWTYRPFLVNGRPEIVCVIVSLPSVLGLSSAMEKKDAAVGQLFYPKVDSCRAASFESHWAEAVNLCADAVEIADRYPDIKFRANEIRGAHQSYGVALMFAGRLPDALEQLRAAVELAKASLTPKDAEYAPTFRALASAEAASKMFAEADRDYGIAEDSYRQLAASGSSVTKAYELNLARSLRFHSIVEEQMGNDLKAKSMRSEALTLDPHAFDGTAAAK